MDFVLESRAIEVAAALAAAAWCGIVVWKSIDYVVTTRRDRRERPDDVDRDA